MTLGLLVLVMPVIGKCRGVLLYSGGLMVGLAVIVTIVALMGSNLRHCHTNAIEYRQDEIISAGIDHSNNQ